MSVTANGNAVSIHGNGPYVMSHVSYIHNNALVLGTNSITVCHRITIRAVRATKVATNVDT